MGPWEGAEGFFDIPFDEYRKQSWAISSSDLNLLIRAPALYKHVVIDGHRRGSTKSLEEGSAVHAAVLEPEVFRDLYVIEPKTNKRTLFGKKEIEDFKSQHKGKITVDADDHARFLEISKVVRANKEADDLLRGCEFEKSFFWKQKDFSLHSKARADAINLDGNYVVDLKTTRDAKNFLHSIEEYGYHRQAAYYLSGASKLCDRNINTWYWIAVETAAPYLVRVYKASQEMLIIGQLETKVLMRRLEPCLQSKSFPGLAPGIKELNLSERYVQRSSSKFTEEI